MRFVQSVLNIMIVISAASLIISGFLLVVVLTGSNVFDPIFSNIPYSVTPEKKLAYLLAFIISGLVWLVSREFSDVLKRIEHARQ